MITGAQLAKFWRSAAQSKLGELPKVARESFDTQNWRQNATRGIHDYKKMMDKGDAKPLLHLVGGLFVFNYFMCLPKVRASAACPVCSQQPCLQQSADVP